MSSYFDYDLLNDRQTTCVALFIDSWIEPIQPLALVDFFRDLSPAYRLSIILWGTSLIVAAWLWRRERKQSAIIPPEQCLFSVKTWLSRSAINDYSIIVVNSIIGATLLAPIAI